MLFDILNGPQVHLHCCKWQNIILCRDWIVLCSTCVWLCEFMSVCVCVHFDYSCILWQALRLTPFLAAINNAEMNPRCKWSLDPDSILCGCAPRRGPGCSRAFSVRRVLYTLHFFHSAESAEVLCVWRKWGSAGLRPKHRSFLPLYPKAEVWRWASHSYCSYPWGNLASSLFQNGLHISGPKMVTTFSD